jgi:hypothetical protein
MPIEVIDIRSIPNSSRNTTFTQMDFIRRLSIKTSSLSCLHSIDQFGLGRYGDPINPQRHIQGFINLVGGLEPGGKHYISYPIGSKERVEFNSHRVFDPKSIFTWPAVEKLELMDFSWVDDNCDFHPSSKPSEEFSAELNYVCGIYTFKRN